MSDPAFENEIRTLVLGNQKINAVKLYRDRTGVGLADAKAAVEAIAEGRGTAPAPASPAYVDDDEPSTVDEPLDDVLRRLTASDQKIEAIKLYRQRSGLGLAEAKQYVDSLAAGRPNVSHQAPIARNPGVTGASFDAELTTMVAGGRKIEAIKLYRERTNAGLLDAKNYVEALETRAIPALGPARTPAAASPSGLDMRTRKPFSDSASSMPTSDDGALGWVVAILGILLIALGGGMFWLLR